MYGGRAQPPPTRSGSPAHRRHHRHHFRRPTAAASRAGHRPRRRPYCVLRSTTDTLVHVPRYSCTGIDNRYPDLFPDTVPARDWESLQSPIQDSGSGTDERLSIGIHYLGMQANTVHYMYVVEYDRYRLLLRISCHQGKYSKDDRPKSLQGLKIHSVAAAFIIIYS